MENKLELKHIAPYLPYGLKVKHTRFLEFCKVIERLDFVECLSSECVTFKNSMDYYFDDENECEIKLILRPLSGLTTEIEHNGEKFVPVERLFEIENPEHIAKGRNYHYANAGRFITCYGDWCSVTTSINIKEIEKNNYWKIKKLLEWHFDIFGSIEQKLAIDINTLNK